MQGLYFVAAGYNIILPFLEGTDNEVRLHLVTAIQRIVTVKTEFLVSIKKGCNSIADCIEYKEYVDEAIFKIFQPLPFFKSRKASRIFLINRRNKNSVGLLLP